jgi:hypothetical protein
MLISVLYVQVYRNPEPQMYSLEVGPNVDIAFLAICTSAIDLIQLRQQGNLYI